MSLNIAKNLLQRARELSSNNRYSEALICYQEGIELLLKELRDVSNANRPALKAEINVYMTEAEKLKSIVDKLKKEGNYHEQLHIMENTVGYSYETVFKRFLDENVTSVKIEDPYVRIHHQFQNFVRFCELMVRKCKNLQAIELLTVKVNEDQPKFFLDLGVSLANFKVKLIVAYSTTLHDRQIILSNGWIVKIGRGLDYFKASKGKLALGTFDLDLRPCHETTIDVFHSITVRKS